jgi:hypothetical protein
MILNVINHDFLVYEHTCYPLTIQIVFKYTWYLLTTIWIQKYTFKIVANCGHGMINELYL